MTIAFEWRELPLMLLLLMRSLLSVPIDVSTIHMLYVFVDIAIDSAHLIRSMIAHFPQQGSKIVLAGTIQFATALAHVAQELSAHFGADSIFVPQAKPLSKGEVLGCTSPKFDSSWQTVVFLADGRFHLESLMIANPHIREFFKYDPYGKKLTRESYGYDEMHRLRKEAIATATQAKRWGLILGTLGRQGNVNILSRIESLLQSKNLPYTVVLLSEIFPDKLARMSEVEAWVQVACPRLSIDWSDTTQRATEPLRCPVTPVDDRELVLCCAGATPSTLLCCRRTRPRLRCSRPCGRKCIRWTIIAPTEAAGRTITWGRSRVWEEGWRERTSTRFGRGRRQRPPRRLRLQQRLKAQNRRPRLLTLSRSK